MKNNIIETYTSSGFPNVNFGDKIVGSATPSKDVINQDLLKDVSDAAKKAGVEVSITTAVTGHKKGGRHETGNAVDIAVVNGLGFSGGKKDAEKKGIYDDIMKFVDALESMGYKKNVESGNDKAVLTFGFPGHDNHIHISRKSGSKRESKKISGQLGFKKYSGQAANNIKLIISKLKKEGITDPITQLGILSTIGKESGFIPQNEIGYCKTSDSQIIDIFKNRGRKCKSLKCDDPKFFECVYGSNSGVRLGNTTPGDGYKFRGRGFNQITGRGNYRAYGYENNPDALNNPEGAADAAIKFLTKGKGSSLNNKFKNIDEAIQYFVDINAGGSASGRAFRNAKKVASNFTFDGVESIEDIDTDSSGLLDVFASDGKGPSTFIDIFRTLGDVLSPDKKVQIGEDINRINDLIKKVL